MSGLTLGLLSFDKMSLEILIASGSKGEQRRAKCIYSIVKHHHWLLVTLLICNAIAMEALPLFLDKMVPGAIAILLSVSFILLFGEIIPQAICSRYALSIGYYATVFIWILMIISCPISLPIALLLDCVLGKHKITLFRRSGLSELVAKHGQEKGEGPLSETEIKTIRGALTGADKSVSHDDVMTKLDDVYMLDSNTLLNRKTILEMTKMGHSRIPVFEGKRQNVIGLLLVKQLVRFFGIEVDADPVSLGSLELRKMPAVDKDFTLWDMLHIFKDGNTHMALVYSREESKFHEDSKNINFVRYIGVVTLEEVIEELIQVEIYDEFDGIGGRGNSADDTGSEPTPILAQHAGVAEIVRKCRLHALKKPPLKKATFDTTRGTGANIEIPMIEKEEDEGENEVEIVVDGYELSKTSRSVEINKLTSEYEDVKDGNSSVTIPLLSKPVTKEE